MAESFDVIKRENIGNDFGNLETGRPTDNDSSLEIVPADSASQGILIPLSIFSSSLGSLESITKYLRETVGLRNCDIAGFTNRDERTIWGSYSKALAKSAEILPAGDADSHSGIMLPLSILNNRELGVLESISFYLKEDQKLKYSQIARLLQRDQRTIWTAVSRAKRKIAGRVAQ